MSYIRASLYKHSSERILDPESAIRIAKDHFPEAVFSEGDQLERSWRFAEQHLDMRQASARTVVQSLKRKAQSFGPAYAFRIHDDSGAEILGCIRRVDVCFTAKTSISDRLRDRIVTFIRAVFPQDISVDIVEGESNTRRRLGYTGSPSSGQEFNES
jgi:hypothetical protein